MLYYENGKYPREQSGGVAAAFSVYRVDVLFLVDSQDEPPFQRQSRIKCTAGRTHSGSVGFVFKHEVSAAIRGFERTGSQVVYVFLSPDSSPYYSAQPE